MIKRIFTFIAAGALMACGANAGPILVGQGTGESEYSLTFARANLAELLRTCAGLCALNDEQEALLSELVKRAGNPPTASFVDLNSASVFELSEDQKEVKFNQDLLWSDNRKTAAFTIPYALTVWVDVLARLTPEFTAAAEDLKRIREELLLVMSQRMLRYASPAQQESPAFEALVWKGIGSDRLYIRNRAFESYDFTSALTETLGCAGAPVTEFALQGFRWSEVSHNENGGLAIRVETMQTWRCGEERARGSSKIVMRTGPKDRDGVYAIQPESVRVFSEGE